MTSPEASLRLGAVPRGDAVGFRVWAPRCRTLEVVVEGRAPLPMTAGAGGLFEARAPGLRAGARYRYRLDGARECPDPASRFQPQGVHGPSAVVDPGAFAWTDGGFRGHALADLVIYEAHVGAFTPAGTFEAIVAHLPRLADLGVTALELMPVAEFPGARNWGYDGAHLFAPQSTYGGPRGLRRLVDACHAHGLSVILDVVYNHLGPEGSYLGEFAPYVTDRHRTPWGGALDFDGPAAAGVRRHVVENARMWAREFHVDGFRLDAIHAIHDASPVHVLAELAEAAREEARALGRPLHVMAESHDNDRRLVLPAAAGGLGLDALWSDDFHHALHARLTGERTGYYVDYGDAHRLATALAEGFAFQGEPSAYYGVVRGTPSADLPAERFVVFVQNHDQVGNRARGERLGAEVPFDAIKLAAGLAFAAPALPLLFMGEEYGETAPFAFFTSFQDPDLTAAVRRGRAAEFARFAWPGAPPDPGDPATFARARLDHALAAAPRHRELREYYRRWLALRRAHPALGARGKDRARATWDAQTGVLTLARGAASGAGVRLYANLTGQARPAPEISAAWRVLIDSDATDFAGQGRPALAPWQLILYEAPA
jgi:maltooligosyltrehalose trehalohydrolase